MRRFLTRALGALSLGALLAIGVGATAAAADSTATPAVSSSSSIHARPNGGGDWWT